MMASELHLSRRERQIMDIIYRLGEASAIEVLREMPDPPSYSAVRALLRILEEKNHLHHRKQKAKYIYSPRQSRQRASRTVLHRVVHTFFEGSPEKVVAALLDISGNNLTDTEYDRLATLIEQARKTG
jgi:BlaI family transcriptional regulator, penicillinase repressor